MLRNLDRHQESIILDRGLLQQLVLTNAATTIFTFDENTRIEIDHIHIANTSNQTRWFSLWHDNDGTTYDNTTVIFDEVDISGGDTAIITDQTWMSNFLGSLGGQAQQNNQLTLTIYGTIIRDRQ